MKLETKRISFNGTKVRYLHGGKGKPLLFLHGWPANPTTFKKALELLANNFTIYAPFMFDAECRSAQEIADCVKIMMKELGLANIAVAGISFGGAIAGLLSLGKGTVSHLVLINPAGVPRQASFAKMFGNFLRSSAFMLLKGNVHHLLHRYASSITFFASLRSAERKKLFKEIKTSTKTHACYIFQRLDVQTTIIWCRNDNVFPVSNAAILQKLIRNSKLVVVEGDHHWPFHKPKHFAETIVAHVK